jgi:hypothetical protein
MQQVCRERGWTLLAAHVRTSPAQVVVDCETETTPPEKVMNDLKAYASPALSRVDREGQQQALPINRRRSVGHVTVVRASCGKIRT